MHFWHDISMGDHAPEELTVIVETPKGSQNKYEIDKESGIISLDRVLYGANFFPGDYGFVPRTLWEDGDALDALVMTHNPLFPGCKLSVRPIAVLRMIDSEESDDKLLCVPTKDPRFDHMQDISDIAPHFLKELKHFFETYKLLQNKKVEVVEINDKKAAHETIAKGIRMYEKKFSK